ncbi:hypothetical protein KM043_012763 [Ampulex compressa]|nr:hypothetical protein KM043_012763 [Ampulex compressa]
MAATLEWPALRTWKLVNGVRETMTQRPPRFSIDAARQESGSMIAIGRAKARVPVASLPFAGGHSDRAVISDSSRMTDNGKSSSFDLIGGFAQLGGTDD